MMHIVCSLLLGFMMAWWGNLHMREGIVDIVDGLDDRRAIR